MTPVDLGIDSVEIASRIASGGFATVYRAWQPTLDRWVAVKVLRSADESVVRRFERERRAMGRLSHHFGIVTLYESGLTRSGHPYLIMPYLESGSLQDRLDREGRLEWSEALGLIADIADTVAVAHEARIVHRDLKPANVMLSQDGRPLIADFGIASLAQGPGTATALSLTPPYSAPEVLRGETATAAADVYGLGATLYAMLGGSPPFGTDSSGGLAALLRRIDEDPVPSLHLDVPPSVETLLEVCLAKDPTLRPPASEIARLAGSVIKSPESEPARSPDATIAPIHPPQSETEPKARRWGTPSLRATGTVVAIASVAVVGWLIWGATLDQPNATSEAASTPTSEQQAQIPADATTAATDLATSPSSQGDTQDAATTSPSTPELSPYPRVSLGVQEDTVSRITTIGDSAWVIHNRSNRQPASIDHIDLVTMAKTGSVSLEGEAEVQWIFGTNSDTWIATAREVDEEILGSLLRVDDSTLALTDRIPLEPIPLPDIAGASVAASAAVLTDPFYGPRENVWLIHTTGAWILDPRTGEIVDALEFAPECEDFALDSAVSNLRTLLHEYEQGRPVVGASKVGQELYITGTNWSSAPCAGEGFGSLIIRIDLTRREVISKNKMPDGEFYPVAHQRGIWFGPTLYSRTTLTPTVDAPTIEGYEGAWDGVQKVDGENVWVCIDCSDMPNRVLYHIDPSSLEVHGIELGGDAPGHYPSLIVQDGVWFLWRVDDDRPGAQNPVLAHVDPVSLKTTTHQIETDGDGIFLAGEDLWILNSRDGEYGFDVIDLDDLD